MPVPRPAKTRKQPRRTPRASVPPRESWLHEPFLERAADPKFQDCGQTSLGAFLTLRLIDRFSTRANQTPPEALEYQTHATRDYLLDLRPQAAEEGHLLEIVRVADAVRTGGNRRLLWAPLQAYAYWLEQELRLAEALDVVETGWRLNDGQAVSEEIAARLQRGRILRLLGRFDEAREAYEAACSQAMSIGDTHSALLGRIGDAIVLRQLGNLPGSEKALLQILRDAEQLGDRDAQARAHHDLGLVLSFQQRARGGVPHLYRAFELYEPVAYKMRALSDVGEALKRLGFHRAAEHAFTLVINGEPTVQMRTYTMLELMEIAARTHDRVGFARWKRELDAGSAEFPPETQVDYEVKLGIGHSCFGQLDLARIFLKSAMKRAEEFRLNDYLFRAEAALRAIELDERKASADQAGAGQDGNFPEVEEVAEKLCALRAAS